LVGLEKHQAVKPLAAKKRQNNITEYRRDALLRL